MGRAARDEAAGGQDRSPLTGRPWRDNVPRKLAFEAANPDLKITYDGNRADWRWSAKGRLATGELVDLGDRDLETLLDRLGAP